jgi:hypothetical protein
MAIGRQRLAADPAKPVPDGRQELPGVDDAMVGLPVEPAHEPRDRKSFGVDRQFGDPFGQRR